MFIMLRIETAEIEFERVKAVPVVGLEAKRRRAVVVEIRLGLTERALSGSDSVGRSRVHARAVAVGEPVVRKVATNALDVVRGY